MSWGSRELKVWTQDTSPSPLWPAQPCSGTAGILTPPDSPLAGWALPLLPQSSATVPRHRPMVCGCCHGTVREQRAPAGWWLQGLLSRLCVSALHNLGSEENTISLCPQAPPQLGACHCGPIPWAEGNGDPSATAQRHKALLLLLPVLAPQLLALGFIGAGAFPSVRLPLLVQAADADPLPPAHRDVLLHQACQHAFLG